MGNTRSRFDPDYALRKLTLERINRFFHGRYGTSVKCECMVIDIGIEDHDRAAGLVKYIESKGYLCEYRYSSNRDSGFCGIIEVSSDFTHEFKKTSFAPETQCCICYLEGNGEKMKKVKCSKHVYHKRCGKYLHKGRCPICTFQYLRRKSLRKSTNYRKSTSLTPSTSPSTPSPSTPSSLPSSPPPGSPSLSPSLDSSAPDLDLGETD